MDSTKIIELASEITAIFEREGMTRLDSMFVLEASMSVLQEQSLKELIKKELNKNSYGYPGIH